MSALAILVLAVAVRDAGVRIAEAITKRGNNHEPN
jgi:hypothetical protein